MRVHCEIVQLQEKIYIAHKKKVQKILLEEEIKKKFYIMMMKKKEIQNQSIYFFSQKFFIISHRVKIVEKKFCYHTAQFVRGIHVYWNKRR